MTCKWTYTYMETSFLSHGKVFILAAQRKQRQNIVTDTQDFSKLNERTTACFRWQRIKINMQADIRKH